MIKYVPTYLRLYQSLILTFQIFEHQSRTIIGLERLMLEASGFDFRNRHPQELMIKIARSYDLEKTSRVVRTAYRMSLDLYRTFAPLKQQTATLAFACLELAGRLWREADREENRDEDRDEARKNRDIWTGRDYAEWRIDRGMVMGRSPPYLFKTHVNSFCLETLLDLLELYTHHRTSTAVGPDFKLETFLQVRIPLNQESTDHRIPRFTAWVAEPLTDTNSNSNGSASAYAGSGANGITVNGSRNRNSRAPSIQNVSPKDLTSPKSSVSNGPAAAATKPRASDRGKEGTVRFILNPDREREETSIVQEYREGG
jgi:CTD kinase subunit beta